MADDVTASPPQPAVLVTTGVLTGGVGVEEVRLSIVSSGTTNLASSPRAWLLALPNGAYTVARTTTGGVEKQGPIVHLEQFHVNRLVDSHLKLHKSTVDWKKEGGGGCDEGVIGEPKALSLPQLRAFIGRVWKDSIQAFSQNFKGKNECLMVTTLVLDGDEDDGETKAGTHSDNQCSFRVWAHVRRMMPAKQSVTVQFFGNPRRLPKAKLSSWVRERKTTEQHKLDGVDEMILVERDRIYEGLTSNFFVVNHEGVIETAPTGILEGAMREFVLESCSKLGIRVVQRFPKLSEIGSWKEAFITNTVKKISSVDTAWVQAESSEGGFQWKKKEFSTCQKGSQKGKGDEHNNLTTIERIRRHLLEHLV
mmetsp:Transcript_4164/g.9767  ORF Transcript_4164/g.9767 Transcript_4164/m.9767 type:complete len:365 (-) Transcript_4164:68-1162(-)